MLENQLLLSGGFIEPPRRYSRVQSLPDGPQQKTLRRLPLQEGQSGVTNTLMWTSFVSSARKEAAWGGNGRRSGTIGGVMGLQPP